MSQLSPRGSRIRQISCRASPGSPLRAMLTAAVVVGLAGLAFAGTTVKAGSAIQPANEAARDGALTPYGPSIARKPTPGMRAQYAKVPVANIESPCRLMVQSGAEDKSAYESDARIIVLRIQALAPVPSVPETWLKSGPTATGEKNGDEDGH